MKKHFLSVVLISFVLLSFGCKKPPTSSDDNKPALKKEFVWSIDTLFFDYPYMPPDQINLHSIWGSSPTNVWAVGHSDIPSGRLWHYDGNKWTPDKNCPLYGFENGNSFILYPYAVTGFDAKNVFLACDKYFSGTIDKDSAVVLKWDGINWEEVPYKDGKRIYGGFGWIEQQGKTRCWALAASGLVTKYENGFLSIEPRFTDYRLGIGQIAPLANGEVYVSAYKESLSVEQQPLGTMTKLYRRNIDGKWEIAEEKFMAGTDFDGNGYGRGIFGVGNKLFTDNRGIWEKTILGWTKILNMSYMGGACLTSENDLWFYFRHELWHSEGKEWQLIDLPILDKYPGSYLYGTGWSDSNEIFISLHYNGKTYILHGKTIYK
ncbi:MAG: hypothetical protein WCS69_12955 [Ignavibacteriaceae bacterium]|jgi:hypothetical protein